MTNKTRYSLILIGFITFLILAPLIVLYVRGLSFDFKTRSFTKTGIMAFVVDPGSSQIYLNGKLERQGSGDIKFLPEGEYDISVKNERYLDWNKRLSVTEGQVTWVNPQDGKVRLFFKSPKQTDLANSVNDFFVQGNRLLYLQNLNVVTSSVSGPEVTHNFPLPKPANKILTQDFEGNNFIFTDSVSSVIYFNYSSGKIVDLSNLFTQIPKLQFANGNLYALTNHSLNIVNLEDKTLKNILNDIEAFYIQGDDIYLVQKDGEQYSLAIARQPYQNVQVLIQDLEQLKSPQLFVSFGKQIFIMSEKNLYLASSSMQLLAQNVTQYKFDDQNSYFTYSHSGEFSYYDTQTQHPNFVTRSSTEPQNPQISTAISNAFYSSPASVNVIELDGRGTQNSYNLYAGTNITKFYVDNSGKNIVVLDEGKLKNINIR